MLYLLAIAAIGAFLAYLPSTASAAQKQPVPGGPGTLPQAPTPDFSSMTDVNAIVLAAMNAMDNVAFTAAAQRLQQLGPAGTYAATQIVKLAAMSALSPTFTPQAGETWRISMIIAPAAAATGQVPTKDQYAKIMAASNATVKSYDYNASNAVMPMLTTEVTYGQPSVIKVLTLPGIMMTNSVERMEKQADGRMMYVQKYPPDSILSAH